MKKTMCAGCKKKSCDGCRWDLSEKLHTIKDAVQSVSGFKHDKREGYGIVFDIGTTTIAGYLLDLQTGECLCAESCSNPQREFGSDVISRIGFCLDEKGNSIWERMQEMQSLLMKDMEKLAAELLHTAVQGTDVKRISVVGNTAMCSLFAGISVESLGRAPFRKPYQGCISRLGRELGLFSFAEAEVIILPSVEGYVGADALAVYHYIKETDDRKNILAVDVGTNGEILLIGEKNVYACSTAAGPALEGGAVAQGMCGTKGAIEEVKLSGAFPREDLMCRVIGGGRPEGICGSGLVDALAVLYQLKVIDENGYLRSAAEARKAGVRERICQRIREEAGVRSVLLTEEDAPVYLTAEDIRELQLAKAAIAAAIRVLMEKAGITAEEVCRVYLAGAFGSYIKKESALTIGLLPNIEPERIIQTGNCAALGGMMALLSEEVLKKMEESAREIEHIELAEEKTFEGHYLNCIMFP